MTFQFISTEPPGRWVAVCCSGKTTPSSKLPFQASFQTAWPLSRCHLAARQFCLLRWIAALCLLVAPRAKGPLGRARSSAMATIFNTPIASTTTSLISASIHGTSPIHSSLPSLRIRDGCLPCAKEQLPEVAQTPTGTPTLARSTTIPSEVSTTG